MTSLINLFMNMGNTIEPPSINEMAVKYKKDKNNQPKSKSLTQGEKFNNYQKRITKDLEKHVNNYYVAEGFDGIPEMLKKLNPIPNGLTEKSLSIIKNNNYSSQQQTIENLRQEHAKTLKEYESLTGEIQKSASGYFDRINPSNPYLNKTVSFLGGQLCYVTNAGVAKWIANTDILNSANIPQQSTKINIKWDDSYKLPGSKIPTIPPLVSGTPLEMNQRLGNEGSNVFVNSLISNPSISYTGCYADNTTTPLMTFMGGSPPPPSLIQNGNFDQPSIDNNTYQYINSSSQVPGWNFNAVLINNSSAWGYPTPYPNGDQALCIQGGQTVAQTFAFQANVQYTVSLVACGRNTSGQSNSIQIELYSTANDLISTIYTFQPPINSWTNYSATFTVSTTQNYQIYFKGTPVSGLDISTAIQNIKIQTDPSTSGGTYTYDSCKQTAIDNEYKYFSLQGVNDSTSQGYCAVSNNEPTITQLGDSQVETKSVELWSSKTNGQPGNTAKLNHKGSLKVFNSAGTAVFNTPNSKSNPNDYIGCYGDESSRAMTLQNGGKQQYTHDTCQQLAIDNGDTYFGLQNSTSGTNAQCASSSDLTSALKYGKAGNCTKISDGTFSGGGWSNAVYSTDAKSNYFLVLNNNGNMVIARGSGPGDNQGKIWSSNTKGKQKSPNPKYEAAKGKFGQNWIASGTTMAAGDFIGSNNGSIALIMKSNGNLVLHTFEMGSNCKKMADGNMGSGLGGNAIYNVGQVGIPTNMSQLAYIDQNSGLHTYPSSNTQYTNSYTEIKGADSTGNDIAGSSYGNATPDACKTTCNNTPDCAGFTFSNGTCYPKTSSMYPSGEKQINSTSNLYMRNKGPINPSAGISQVTHNIDSINYQKYNAPTTDETNFSLSGATSTQKQQMDQLQTRLTQLSEQINSLTGKFGDGAQQASNQENSNNVGIKNFLYEIKTTDKKIKGFGNNIDNMLTDSDIVVLQKNYNYLFWSILAIGSALVSMNVIKK
ncbi:DUF642 domain-containing protein [bacterium]|nr:DUF642 domain-containing protein [bacterium]